MKRDPAGDVARKAGLLRRAVALLVDQLLFVVTLALLVAALPAGSSIEVATEPTAGLPVTLLAVGFAVFFGYFVVLEAIYGYTAGKAVLGIAVVGEDGSAIGWSQSIFRNLLRIVDSLPAGLYLVAVVAVALTDEEQRIGDLAAGTLVVEQR